MLLNREDQFMSTELKNSMACSAILVMLGVFAIYGGVRLLALLLPAAVLVWYEWSVSQRRGKDRQLGPTAGMAGWIDHEWDNRTMRTEAGPKRMRTARRAE
jgi:hypothetical protein